MKLIIFLLLFMVSIWNLNLKKSNLGSSSDVDTNRGVQTSANSSTSNHTSSWFISNTGFSNISENQSTLTPSFDLDSFSDGDVVILLKDANNSCENGLVMDVAFITSGNLSPTLSAKNYGIMDLQATYRLKVIDSLNNSTCLDEITYNNPNFSPIISFSMSAFNSCFVQSSGKVKCMGYNSVGQLGD